MGGQSGGGQSSGGMSTWHPQNPLGSLTTPNDPTGLPTPLVNPGGLTVGGSPENPTPQHGLTVPPNYGGPWWGGMNNFQMPPINIPSGLGPWGNFGGGWF